MKKAITKISFIMILLSILVPGMAQTENASPIDNLPPYITLLTTLGQRADWSHDGERILFIEKTFGDVYEFDLKTKKLRPMTHHYFHEGYTRALYLSNGDILLSGARHFDADDPWPSRSEENAELWVLKHDLSGAPVPLGEHCSEGPAVSRTRMRIAWTQNNKIYSGDIVNDAGAYHIVGKQLILDAADLDFKCNLETQNFRPPEEKEIIFSAYDYQGGEVMGVNIETGEVRNYSNADHQYDEPEGIFPDGKYTLVESDRHVSKGEEFKGIQYIDIHKLALDGSGTYERITHFSDYTGWKATNPVVSDDGRFIAFQYAKYGDPAGVGRGILLFDIGMFEKMKRDNPYHL
jgi:Tol biopolymer transport system component